MSTAAVMVKKSPGISLASLRVAKNEVVSWDVGKEPFSLFGLADLAVDTKLKPKEITVMSTGLCRRIRPDNVLVELPINGGRVFVTGS